MSTILQDVDALLATVTSPAISHLASHADVDFRLELFILRAPWPSSTGSGSSIPLTVVAPYGAPAPTTVTTAAVWETDSTPVPFYTSYGRSELMRTVEALRRALDEANVVYHLADGAPTAVRLLDDSVATPPSDWVAVWLWVGRHGGLSEGALDAALATTHYAYLSGDAGQAFVRGDPASWSPGSWQGYPCPAASGLTTKSAYLEAALASRCGNLQWELDNFECPVAPPPEVLHIGLPRRPYSSGGTDI